MSKEAILKIQDVEAEAERMVGEAKSRAKQMIEQAEQAGRALEEQTEKDTAAELATMLEQIRNKTELTAQRMAEEATEASEELKKAAKLRQRSAEKIVIRGLEAKCR